jgi:hypothetical protein
VDDVVVLSRWVGDLQIEQSPHACSTVIPWTACAKHHITGQRYRELLYAQNGVCAICGMGNFRMGECVPLGIDHDHACCPGKSSCGRCVRGPHCSSCGGFLGFLEYNGGPNGGRVGTAKWTKRAMNYLASHAWYRPERAREA